MLGMIRNTLPVSVGLIVLRRLGVVGHQVEALHIHEHRAIVWRSGGSQNTDDRESFVMAFANGRIPLTAVLRNWGIV